MPHGEIFQPAEGVRANMGTPLHQRKRDVRVAQGSHGVLSKVPGGAPQGTTRYVCRLPLRGRHFHDGAISYPHHLRDSRKALREARIRGLKAVAAVNVDGRQRNGRRDH